MGKEAEFERDLVLAPNTFAYILDKTQGEVVCHVGPTKLSLADSDQPVAFNSQSKRFDEVPLARSIQPLVIAPEGWYLILKNPALTPDGGLRLPTRGKNSSQEAELTVGRKANFHGPVSMPLWPGQMAQVVQGHHLRSNQYLRARVYDEEAAVKNRDQAIIKASAEGAEGESGGVQARSLIPENLTIGQQFNIKGTDVSFFIPPTGIEIVRDENGEFIRDAETLEVLEYCILLDEDGNKSFVRGPAVVFPSPTQTFVTKTRSGHEVRKFLAFELNENMGLYIKVIKEYTEGEGETTRTFHPGEELFITGKTDPVYFPREEHAIIQYGDKKKINYSVAIPAGEGRYVLNRNTGEIRTVTGPTMLLPDPRTEVVVRRVLKEQEVGLMYPGNVQAIEVNRQLDALRSGSEDYVLSNIATMDSFAVAAQEARSIQGQQLASGPKTRSARRKAMKDFAGDQLHRGENYTPPRTITLDNKYDGIVTVNVWTGYAVNVVKRTGERRVVVGPQTVMLDYDESLEYFSLSKGCPKDKRNRKKDVYLRVSNNRVTDRINLQTKDLVDISVVLSYRVNFTGDESRWFDVDDYVGLLTDHMRSVLRNAVQNLTVEEFWTSKIDILRNFVLGESVDGARDGRLFEQNGMMIYDVDFVDAEIHDREISSLLVNAQHDSVRLNLDLDRQRRDFEVFNETERLRRQRAEVADETASILNDHKLAELNRRKSLVDKEVTDSNATEVLRLENRLGHQETLDNIQASELERTRRKEELNQNLSAANQQLRLAELEAVKQAEIERLQAVTPGLVEAMNTLSQTELIERVTQNLSPLAILGGESVVDVAKRLLTGTALEQVIDKLPELRPGKPNGTTRPLP